ncbi:MAG: hypothetical protein ACOZF2_03335, partial [Thermodesulfobacteriota bacterium]
YIGGRQLLGGRDMKPGEAVMKLTALGYRFEVTGERLRWRFAGQGQPDPGKDGLESVHHPVGKPLGTADMELQYQFLAQSWGAMGVTEENLSLKKNTFRR